MNETGGDIDLEARVAALEKTVAEQNAELELSREEAAAASVRLLDALESLSEGFVLVNGDRVVTVSNEQLGVLFRDDYELWSPGRALPDIAGRLDARGYDAELGGATVSAQEAIERLVAGDAPSVLINRGDDLCLSVNGRTTFDAGCVMTFTDMSGVKRQQRQLKTQSQLLQSTVDAIHEGLAAFSGSGELVAWNARLCDLLDQSADALHLGLGHTDFLRMLATRGLLGAGEPDTLVERRAGELRAGHMLRNHEIFVGGRHLEVSEFAMPNGGHVATFTDVTDRREAEQLLFKQATTDELTGLPNRVVGIYRLHTAVAQAKRS
ncbi:MAG: PAS-domain containing protein, partial [Pseudomonadota bacterium]